MLYTLFILPHQRLAPNPAFLITGWWYTQVPLHFSDWPAHAMLLFSEPGVY